jgi:hypothetical protein
LEVTIMRWIICGGRDYTAKDYAFLTLDALASSWGKPDLVIDGAAKGADTIGHEWAKARGVDTKRVPADWDKHGKAAGPIRNQAMLNMLDAGDLVVALPGGKGTADMVKRAKLRYGVNVVRLRDRMQYTDDDVLADRELHAALERYAEALMRKASS